MSNGAPQNAPTAQMGGMSTDQQQQGQQNNLFATGNSPYAAGPL